MRALTFNMLRASSTSSKVFRLACKLSREINKADRKQLVEESTAVLISPIRFYSLLSSRLMQVQRASNLTCARQIGIINNKQNQEISETTILLQQGLEFQEVPIAVLKSDAIQSSDFTSSSDPVRSSNDLDLDPLEEAAFIEGFNSYQTPQEVLRILDTIPFQDVTPLVSFTILKKLKELESNFGFRNDGKSWIVSMDNGTQETFVRGAVIRELISKIISSNDSRLLLDTLDILRSDNNQNYFDSVEFSSYRNKLCDEIFVMVAEGKLPLKEACRAICAFGEMVKDERFKIDKKFVDKMWVIVDKGHEVTIDNVVDVFKTVQYFTKSQRLVYNLVERKLLTLWWRLDLDAVAQICDIIGTNKPNDRWNWCINGQLLMSLSKCTALNLHQVQENQLERIIKCFYHQNFCDVSMEQALTKYMKARGSKITSPSLIATIMDYAKKFRLRSFGILEGCVEYVLFHSGANLSPPQITSIITCFGHLNSRPSSGIKFWNIVEKLLEDKFVQFPPKDLLDIFLSCLYLEKYPLNFVNRIFSPYFLDRLNSSEADYSDLQNVRSSLKLLDTALHLECGWKYSGPLLPKNFFVRTLNTDGRIVRAVNMIKEPIMDICHEHCNVEKSFVLPTMPIHELYVVDIVVIPFKGTESQVYNYVRNRICLAREGLQLPESQIMCILINIPEHFSSDREHLIGPQAMRIKHLKALGFKVANIKYSSIVDVKQQSGGLDNLLKSTLVSLDCPGVTI